MRLLNVYSWQLKEFIGRDVPVYAILSHTWGAEEVTFEDLIGSRTEATTFWWLHDNPPLSAPASSRKGFAKLHGWCRKALEEGFEWVWIDTCCINKSSSTELSEAINSMFRWYGDAGVCYAYLEDHSRTPDMSGLYTALGPSRWFTRGWTLQELIAPSEVVFLASDWTEIGTRHILCESIEHITKIDKAVLRSPSRMAEFSVAQRMSWASMRDTTRIEDQAYCLLGLFDVNMPLLYGEGEKAFLRLQQIILSKTNDSSILAWQCNEIPANAVSPWLDLTGLLAPSTRCFQNMNNLVALENIWRATPSTSRENSISTEDGLQLSTALDPRISIKMSGNHLKLAIPTFGPLQHDEHREADESFAQVGNKYISERTTPILKVILDRIFAWDTEFGSLPARQPERLRQFYATYDNVWPRPEDGPFLAIVARYRHQESDTRQAADHSPYVGILLVKHKEHHMLRVHGPSLVGIKLDAELRTDQRFLAQPLQKFTAAVTLPAAPNAAWAKSSGLLAARPLLVIKIPTGFVPKPNLDSPSFVLGVRANPYRFLFSLAPGTHPGLRPPLEGSIHSPLMPLEFTGGTDAGLPDFTLYFCMSQTLGATGKTLALPRHHVSLRLGKCESSFWEDTLLGRQAWPTVLVDYGRTCLFYTPHKEVWITCRSGPVHDILSITIEPDHASYIVG